MSKSDYDLLAFDNEGQPGNGVLEHPHLSTHVEIYKNWLYVRDDDGWAEGRGWNFPTIAQINQGEIEIAGFNVTAVRGPQESIFVHVECYSPNDHQRMAGIGGLAYEEPTDKILAHLGLTLADEDYSISLGSSYENGQTTPILSVFNAEGVKSYPYPDLPEFQTTWPGITAETYQAFLLWLSGVVQYGSAQDLEWLEKIKASTPLRFNQGDGFFAAHLSVSAQASEVGQANTPYLIQMTRDTDKPSE